MEGRGLTYLVKKLVLSKVPDVLRLLHGRKTRGDTERPVSCDREVPGEASSAGSQHPALGNHPRALLSIRLAPPLRPRGQCHPSPASRNGLMGALRSWYCLGY